MPLQREPLDPALPPAPSRPRYEDNEPHPSGMNRKQRRAAIITGRATLQRRNPFRGVCGFVPGITAKHVQLRRCSYP